MAGKPPFLVMKGLVKSYPGVVALNGADFELQHGQVLGLVGKNGAGKSTLIKVLAGAVMADEGAISIDGSPVTINSPQQSSHLGLAFVHQELADIPNLTVAENIELGIGFPKRLGFVVNRRALRRKAQDVLDRLSVEVDPSALVSTLSVAQRRMVMIARGLSAQARVLALDEPSASLSETEITHLYEIIRTLKREGVAIIYVSHRLDEILNVTDSVLVMRDGRNVYAAPTETLTKTKLITEIAGDSRDALERLRKAVAPSDAKELLRTEQLSRDGVVENVDMTLQSGEVLGIAGMVGSGRTELARLLFGADRPTSGRMFVEGREVDLHSPRAAMRAGIALLPEDRRHEGSILDFPVFKNVTLTNLPRYRRGGANSFLPFPSAKAERAAAAVFVERLDIKVPSVDHPVRNLSGGNQQKVVLAKWLGLDASIFIFDEPTAGIDVSGKGDVYNVMEDLAMDGKGVIFISSEFSEIVGVCSRVLIMREGRIVGVLEGDAITEAALIERCYGHDESLSQVS